MFKNDKNKIFWTNGNGKDFLDWAKITESELQINYNSELFYKYDIEGDFLAREWLKNDDLKPIMQSLHSKRSAKKLPEDYLKLRKSMEEIPNWVDFNLIEEGCKLSERSGLNGLLLLRDFALLGGYNFANLTKPLVATGSLEKGALHRLYNTLNFWVNVSRSKADNQSRIDACLHTRLVHSISRLNILDQETHWNHEKYGIPINYADMIATNTAFTVYFLYGLHKLNFDYSEKEELGIFHLWKYVTYLLGVPVELIPNNKQEALNFFYFWTQYQAEADQDARKLAESLLLESTSISLLKLDIVKRNMDFIHKSVANYLIDETIRENLKIPNARFGIIVIQAMKLKNSFPISRDSQVRQGKDQQESVLNDYKNNSAFQKKK